LGLFASEDSKILIQLTSLANDSFWWCGDFIDE